MKNIDFKIDTEDLMALFAAVKFAYGNITFDAWVKECKKSYISYIKVKENTKTYSQWVNGQIISLT